MPEGKQLRDLAISITEYPHMPYWATLREAIVQLNVAYETGHHTVLVFDEAYSLLGLLHQSEILKGIRPEYAELCPPDVQIKWEDLMETATGQLEKPIQDFMTAFDVTVDINDHLLKVAHLMINNNIGLLPVMESNKIMGVIRMHELFYEVAEFILKSKL
jgi:signal-transduction protein with cAMP-binding, CBS, and nucleotidyltransferase domain